MKAWNIFLKNLKVLIRSRSSGLIIILGPLLVILLVGMSFNTSSKYELSVGVYTEEQSDLTTSFVTKMKEANLRVTDYPIKDSCIDDVKTGNINICLYFPKMALEDNSTNEIVFYVDPSKVNLVTVVMNAVSSKVSERSEEITRDLTTVLTESLAVSQQEAASIKPRADAVFQNIQISKVKVKDTIAMLDALNLTFDMSAFNPQNMSDTSLKVNRSIEEFRSSGYEAVEKGWELVDYLDVHMAGISDSQEKSNIMIKKRLIKLDLDALNQTLNRKGNFSDTGIGDLFFLVERLRTNLVAVNYQFDQINTARKQSLANLNDADARLGNDLQDMAKVRASIDNITSTITSIQVTNVGSISRPVRTTISPVIAEKTLLNYLFSSIIVLVVMFICIILAATLVVSEKNSSSGFRSAITPTGNVTFFIGTFVTVLAILILQAVVIMGVTIYLFNAEFLMPQLSVIAVILLLIITTFILLGMLIGHMFKTEETATLASITIGSVMLFVSNLVLPLESISAYARQAAQYNPFVIGDNMLQKASLFNAKLPALLPQIKLLAIYCGILFVAILVVEYFQKTHLMHKIGFKLYTKRQARGKKKQEKKAEKKKEEKK